MAFLQQLHQTINDQDLLLGSETVLVAFSGGPDSSALLHGLHSLGYDVQAAHLHHGLRGQEADDDAKHATEFCKTLRIPLTLEHWDVATIKRREHLSTQEAARNARRQFLSDVAERVQAVKIATAHNQDDRIESVLMNIVRGTGTEGLRGIAYRNGMIVRPLLDVPRPDIEVYCAEHRLLPRYDSSNESTQYSRNNVRHELLPYLERRYNPETRAALLRLSQIASLESDFLRDQARFWLSGQPEIPVPALRYEAPALQRRILREWLRAGRDEALTNISFELIERILSNLSRCFSETLPGADVLIRGDGKILRLERLEPDAEPQAFAQPVVIGEIHTFFDWIITVFEYPEGVDGESLIVKTWEDGDRISLPGGTRKLQDVFTDAKLPRAERRRYPVLADKVGILTVPGLATATRARGINLSLKAAAETIEA